MSGTPSKIQLMKERSMLRFKVRKNLFFSLTHLLRLYAFGLGVAAMPLLVAVSLSLAPLTNGADPSNPESYVNWGWTTQVAAAGAFLADISPVAPLCLLMWPKQTTKGTMNLSMLITVAYTAFFSFSYLWTNWSMHSLNVVYFLIGMFNAWLGGWIIWRNTRHMPTLFVVGITNTLVSALYFVYGNIVFKFLPVYPLAVRIIFRVIIHPLFEQAFLVCVRISASLLLRNTFDDATHAFIQTFPMTMALMGRFLIINVDSVLWLTVASMLNFLTSMSMRLTTFIWDDLAVTIYRKVYNATHAKELRRRRHQQLAGIQQASYPVSTRGDDVSESVILDSARHGSGATTPIMPLFKPVLSPSTERNLMKESIAAAVAADRAIEDCSSSDNDEDAPPVHAVAVRPPQQLNLNNSRFLDAVEPSEMSSSGLSAFALLPSEEGASTDGLRPSGSDFEGDGAVTCRLPDVRPWRDRVTGESVTIFFSRKLGYYDDIDRVIPDDKVAAFRRNLGTFRAMDGNYSIIFESVAIFLSAFLTWAFRDDSLLFNFNYERFQGGKVDGVELIEQTLVQFAIQLLADYAVLFLVQTFVGTPYRKAWTCRHRRTPFGRVKHAILTSFVILTAMLLTFMIVRTVPTKSVCGSSGNVCDCGFVMHEMLGNC
ncbi:hypothetical protein J8273_0356 [Carpediemonas membranifera]|uniref:Transmembrane protein n=1 Tax=Carpediemonas membranifera TaxID=201153 RepID=A0A8J6E4Z9_9EUKA|nr:hypothetical protein J8273_0356 [Carpediemonas membranifera]|eukprot:KAG9395137.1 hypothetical protein J8273_0356 [Carpediemonas membranifera]